MYEIWKAIPDYEGLYDASNWGRVRSLGLDKYHPGRILKPGKTKNGYYRVCLFKDGKPKMFYVHRLVYEAFNGPIPDGMVIDHRDAVKTNNCLENLRVCTQKENQNNPVTRPRHVDALRRLHADPEFKKKNTEAVRKANRKRLSKSVVQINKQTGETIRKWECTREVERSLGINQSNISLCCNGKLKSAGGYKWCFFMPPAVIYNLSTIFEEY